MVTITIDRLRRLAPRGRPDILAAVAAGGGVLDQYDITTPSRIAHFLAQIAHESAGFRTTEEYASGAAYEGRKDLGNVKPGDGRRFKGRGLIQLTGRANYQAYGERLGVDLVRSPERAAEPALSLRIACEYWRAKGLNGLADRDDVVGITKRINGGTNGLADRKALLAKAKAIFAGTPVAGAGIGQPVLELQRDLVALGYDIALDGIDGAETDKAVRDVQRRAGIKVDGIAGPATRDAIRRLLERRPATGAPPAEKTALDALKTPEGLATAGGIATTALGAATNPGPLQWALAAVVVVVLVVAVVFLVRRLRREDS